MAGKAKKHTQGRRKIEMKKIQNEEALNVSFSKRRVGLFKKVSELSILCGAEFAAVAFSPSGRPYSFGHPSVDSIVNRFFNEGPKLAIESSASAQIMAKTNNDLNKKLADLKVVLEKLRQKKEMLEEELKRSEMYIKSDVDKLRMDELKEYERRLVEFSGNVEKHLGRLMTTCNEFGVFRGSVENSGGVMQQVAPLNNEVGVSERGGDGGYFQYGNHLGGGGGASGAMCYGNNAFLGAFQ